MDDLLLALRACAEPTRLRLLALAGRGAFCVMEFTEILGQSPAPPVPSPPPAGGGRDDGAGAGGRQCSGSPCRTTPASPANLLTRLPRPTDPVLEADRRQAARVLAERAPHRLRKFPPAGCRLGRGACPSASGRRHRARGAGGGGQPSGAGCSTSAPATGRLLEQLGLPGRPRPGRGRQPGHARPRPVAPVEAGTGPLRGAPGGHVPATDAGRRVRQPSCSRWCCTMPRIRRPPWPRRRACCAPAGCCSWWTCCGTTAPSSTERLAHRWPGFDDATLASLMHDAGLEPRRPGHRAGRPARPPVARHATSPIAALAHRRPTLKEFA